MIIQHAVWLYLRFTLSYRDVEEVLAERGLDISYETIRCWVLKFGPMIARRLHRRRSRPSNRDSDFRTRMSCIYTRHIRGLQLVFSNVFSQWLFNVTVPPAAVRDDTDGPVDGLLVAYDLSVCIL